MTDDTSLNPNISLAPYIYKTGDKKLLKEFFDKCESKLRDDTYTSSFEMIELANIYYYGTYTEKNIPKAIYWYEKAIEAEKNYTSRYSSVDMAHLALANIYSSREYVNEHKDEAFDNYLNAILRCRSSSINKIAFDISQSCLSKNDIDRFLIRIKSMAENTPQLALWLAKVYKKGVLVERNLNEALKWFFLSDKERAHYNLDLARTYIELGDYKNAKEYAEKCLNLEYLAYTAYEILGQIYANENTKYFDIEKAVDCYKKSILDGNQYAITNLKALACYNVDVKSVLNDIYKQLLENITNRTIKAISELIKDGIGSKCDLESIVENYRDGSLFRLYEDIGDYKNAIKELEKGLNTLSDKQFILRKIARCYEKSGNTEKAFEYWKELADLMNNLGMFKLGFYYETGTGVKQSYGNAIKWYELCVSTFDELSNYIHTEAYTRLGMLYENGYGVERDYKKARELFEKGLVCEYGYYPECAYQLGKLYENGYGVSVNYEKAIEYYRLADELEDAKIALEELTEKLNTHYEKEFSLANSGKSHDVFVSWNHNDKKFMDKLVFGIENYSFDESGDKKAYAHYRAWNSDRDADGLIDACIKNAIDASKFFIVILSESSLQSSWVAKEVKIALEKVKNGLWSYENIIVVYLDEKASEILSNIKNKDNPFYNLKEYTASFVNAEDNDLISNICERIKNGFECEAIRRYISNQQRIGKQFKFVLRNQCENVSGEENVGIGQFIDALIDFENGYLKRDLHSRNKEDYDTKISVDKIMDSGSSFYLYGDGGSGKSLYLTNLINTYFKPPHFFIRINLIDYEAWFSEDKNLSLLLNKELNKYLSDTEEYRFEKSLTRARNGGKNNIIVVLDGLDEINDTSKRILLKMIEEYRKSNSNDRFIFTARKLPFYQDLSLIFDSLKLYEIKGLEKDEQEKLYDIISSKIEKRQFGESSDEQNNLKLDFFIRLSDITGEIKKNPMLLSNLIFIFLKNRGKEFPAKRHEIIGKSVGIFIDELEEERNIRCKYSSYMANGRLRKILEFIAYQKLCGVSLDFEKLICAYFEENEEANCQCIQNGDTPRDVGSEIYKYLFRRAIITTDKITHDIFTAFFASCFAYNNIYESKISKRAVVFKDETLFDDLLIDGYDGFFGCEDGMWNEVSAELIMKLDYEINALDPRPMRERHPSYDTFDKTLTKAIKENGFSQGAIDIISALANEKQGFYFNEFIKRFI